ncbi:DnaJ-domain-containing protein [Paraphaeosphaeria sporulosa]|uniref:DnaJ-domain-containing protein n=1 Tax=Paraphaeosphaeria sporulosa TaxID=1460663 RepID=A0A177BY56_9PLEO|nr:DnaJ-domain-containing protein [Paraphaeosphaeria sporulosa]OAF99618.1 DnaJ-domain-containing protein [Paraphaeosphaeria sporulosa]
MGAQQSTAGGDASAGVHVKTSYYELLGVERAASDDDIKKAYRRKALELHPDRNYGDVERTTALFADISTAYEVLSDPQERAWYDAHEGDILRGGDGGGGGDHYEYNMKVTTAEDISRMMGNFRSNVDFTDSPTGFFGFLRETFDTLAREEERAGDYEGVQVNDYPSFGHKDDTYESGGVVRNFYNVWAGFATVKSFASADLYRTSDAPDRRVRRLMEKENQKLREKGIREFNVAVQTLVAFVRKRDPRYTPNMQTEEDKAKAQREARKQQQERARAANAAKIQDEADAVPEWAKVRDPEELLDESEEEIEEEHFECVACRKTFKSERQWEAHEKSKKHQKAIYALKKKMRKENDFLNLDDDVSSSGAITPARDEEQDDDDDDQQIGGEDRDPEDADKEGKASSDAPAQTPDHVHLGDKLQSHPSGSDDSDNDDDEYASRSDIEARLASYRIDADTAATSTTEGPLENPPAERPDVPEPPAKKLGAAALKRAKRAAKQAEGSGGSDADGMPHRCMRCNSGFPSKTKLFDHIKESGHAAPLSETKGASGKKGKKR